MVVLPERLRPVDLNDAAAGEAADAKGAIQRHGARGDEPATGCTDSRDPSRST
jgi:hypothetical protein